MKTYMKPWHTPVKHWKFLCKFFWAIHGNSNQIVSTALAEWHVMKLDRQGNEGVGLCTWSNFLANNWQTLGLTGDSLGSKQ